MAENYTREEELIESFAKNLNESVFEELTESFIEDPVLLNGTVDMAIALKADYFQRMVSGEFVEAEQYLTELCIHIDDKKLRDKLIAKFDLDREYIESEL